jgi:hypothetical protein
MIRSHSQNIRPPVKPLGALGHALKDAFEKAQLNQQEKSNAQGQ